MLKEESGGSAGNVARGVSCSWQFSWSDICKGGLSYLQLSGLILSSLQFLLLPITFVFFHSGNNARMQVNRLRFVHSGG